MWGIDILGSFPLTACQVKFLLVAVDYFTKWIEVELVATISLRGNPSHLSSTLKLTDKQRPQIELYSEDCENG
ncbi:hypothetical protein CR513_35046, partial [Mucuna pruriens]